MEGAERFGTDPQAFARPWTASPFIESLLAAQGVDERRAAYARSLGERGYIVLERFFDAEQVDRLVERHAWLYDPKSRFDVEPRHLDVLTRDPARRQDAWRVCPEVRALACDPRVLDLLRFLYAREPVPFQTLNFDRGTGQSLHADSYHFSSLPDGFMCGVWVALEDITTRNGPLRYVPGSHLLPTIQPADFGLWAERPDRDLGRAYRLYEEYLQALVAERELEVEELVCPKGTALVWASNLLHGGAPVLDPDSTRRSQVTHYYFEGCAYYTPVFSDAVVGALFLRQIEDIRTGAAVPHRLGGAELRSVPVHDALQRLAHPSEPVAPSPLTRGVDKLRDAARRALGRGARG